MNYKLPGSVWRIANDICFLLLAPEYNLLFFIYLFLRTVSIRYCFRVITAKFMDSGVCTWENGREVNIFKNCTPLENGIRVVIRMSVFIISTDHSLILVILSRCSFRKFCDLSSDQRGKRRIFYFTCELLLDLIFFFFLTKRSIRR